MAGSVLGGEWLSSFRHVIKLSKENRMGEKICQSHAVQREKVRQRLTDSDAEGDSRGRGLLELLADPVSPTGLKQPGICKAATKPWLYF